MFDIKKGVVIESESGRFPTKEAAEKELVKRRKRSEARKGMAEAMRSIGMKKVKGSLGGTYWE